jgi:hypothetical protein
MIKILFMLVVLQTALVFSQEIKIKSLKVSTSADATSIPVLENLKDLLVIDFDLQADTPPNLNIIFKYCDRDWKVLDNIFLSNQGKNTAYLLDYKYLPTTVADANYHYHNKFPDKNGYVEFPFSGKWKFFVVDSQDPSIIFAEGKFIVVIADGTLKVETRKETLDDKLYSPPQLGYVNWFIVEPQLKQDFFPHFIDQVEIIQNHKIYNPINISRNSTDQNRVFEWDGSSKLRFIAKDVRPGNEYRQANLMNTNIYNSQNVKAQFDGLEYTRFYKQGKNDLDGGFTLMPSKDTYATYMIANFQIKPPEEVSGDIYLVGSFNDWQLSEKNKMNFNGDYFELKVELKRGVYDYQYVVVNGDYKNPANQDWFVLEGNDWQTVNEYNVLLWYRDTEYGGYDRIIGYSKLKAK